MIFANTDKEITVIYDSEEHIGRQIMAYAHVESLPIHDIDLKHNALTRYQWAELASRMKIDIKDLINIEDPDFMNNFRGVTDMSDADWLTLLVHNHKILKAPVVMKGKKVSFMENPQEMLRFF